MQEKEIQYILKNRNKLLEVIATKRFCLYDDLSQKEQLMAVSQTYSNQKEYVSLLLSQIHTIKELLVSLDEREKEIQGVLEDFYTLEGIHFDVLYRLYVLNQTWFTVEKELQMAHSDLIKQRKDALTQLSSLSKT